MKTLQLKKVVYLTGGSVFFDFGHRSTIIMLLQPEFVWWVDCVAYPWGLGLNIQKICSF